MECYKVINTVGLLFDIAGALLMFYNTPMHTRKPQFSRGLDEMSKGAEYLYRGKALERKEWKMIRCGVGLLVVGFVAQLISGFLS